MAPVLTLLFSDIEGSTRLMLERGNEYSALLAHYRAVVREALALHDGTEVDTQGDAFFAVFKQAAAAIAAARAIQSSLSEDPIRVRMGVHTGAPLSTGDGYVGPDVHLGARICAAAHGRQMLVSEATRADAAEVELRALGLHRLKDIPEPIQLYQIGSEAFPPLRTLHATNLPVQPVSLIGREALQEDLLTRMTDDGARLVTLVGPGGIGKTSVATAAAAELVSLTPAGVFFVDLTRVRESSQVIPAIAQTIGATGDLAEHIGDKSMLLVLDNMEHVIEAAADVARLVGRCRNLRVLTTSRIRLRVRDERVVPVGPLPEDAALALFLDRARSVDPSFAADEGVVEISRRLDGVPLAIELAASRVGALSTEDLLRRLDNRLALLTGGPRDAPNRQRTLRATIEWSVELLPPRPRALFPRLAVFVGGCTLEAAEQVCQATMDDLGVLVEHNLVHRRLSRYGMLETIREYGADVLAGHPEEDGIREGHSRYYLGTCRAALAASPTWGLVDDSETFRTFRQDEPNLQVSAQWLRDHGAGEELADVVFALWAYWLERGATESGERWIQAALDLIDKTDSLRRMWLTGLLGEFYRYRTGDYRGAIPTVVAALAMARRLGDKSMTASMLATLTVLHGAIGEFAKAQKFGAEALALRRAGVGEHGMAVGRGVAHALEALAELAMRMDEPARAEELLREAASLEAASGTPPRDQLLTAFLIEEAVRAQGRLDEARSAAIDVLKQALESDHSMLILESLVALAGVYSRNAPDLAATFLGAADSLKEQVHLVPFDPGGHRRTLDDVRTALGEGAFDTAFRRGQTRAYGDLIALASDPIALVGSDRISPARPMRGD